MKEIENEKRNEEKKSNIVKVIQRKKRTGKQREEEMKRKRKRKKRKIEIKNTTVEDNKNDADVRN